MSVHVLFLCRANLCRSPSAEVMLARALASAEVEGTVTSAGMNVEEGQSAPNDFLELALERGIDLRDHRQVAFTLADGSAADLVLVMTRDLLRTLVVEHPSLWPKSFTLLELVRRSEEVEPRLGETVGAWVARVHASRDRKELLGNDPVDDIRDPQAEPADGNEVMFGQIERSTRRLARLLYALTG